MNKLKIITNNHWHDFTYGFELSPKEREEFDFLTDSELDEAEFVKYKGQYAYPEFMPCPRGSDPVTQELNGLAQWDGYMSDSFFSGLVIRYSDNFEQYQIGRYSY